MMSRTLQCIGTAVLGLAVVAELPDAVWAQNGGSNNQTAALAESARLNQDVKRLYEAGKYNEAIPLAEKALAIREKVLGPQHSNVAVFLNDLAMLYEMNGDYERAEPLFQRSLSIVEKALGPQHPQVAKALNNLAVLYDNQGRYALAGPLYERTLAIQEKALGAMHPDVGKSLNNLGALYYAKGDYLLAAPRLRRALEIFESLESDDLTVTSILNNLAALSLATGNYREAELLLLRALSISKKILGPEHPSLAQLLNSLAMVYSQEGQYVRAEPLHLRALHIREKALGSEHPDVAQSLNNLAMLYEKKGDYLRAKSLCRRGLRIREKALGPEHPEVAISLNNLALIHIMMGTSRDAEALYRRALRIWEKALGPEHPEVATALNNLAGVFYANGDFVRTEQLFQRALDIREKALGPEHSEVATALNNLAWLYHAKGNYVRAEPLYQRALGIWEKALGPKYPNMIAPLGNLSALHWARDDIDSTILLTEREVSISDTSAAAQLLVGSAEQRRLYMKTLRTNSDRTISLHVQSAGQRDDAKRIAFRTILRRKGLILDAVSNSFVNLRERLTPDSQRKFDHWRMLTAQYSAVVQRGPGKKGIDSFRASLQRLHDAREKAENELSFISKNLQAPLNPVTIEQVEKAIPKGAALVELFRYQPFNPKAKGTEKYWGSARFVAYVLHPSGKLDYADLGEAKSIEDAVKAFRLALSTDARDPRPAARDLYQRVMAPVVKLLGQTKHIYVGPDGALSLVPFGAMLASDDHYVAENYAITYLTTGRDLVRVASPPPQQPAAVFSAPNYEGSDPGRPRAERSFALLWAGSAEGRAVQAKLRKAMLFDGLKASESALKALRGPEVVHISTHGFFDNDLPALHEPPRGSFDIRPPPPVENALLRSGLAFAGANRGGDEHEDGILTALEASQLDLWGTKLVMLSACETGRGQVENGDGVYGLRRAFTIAGAETVVMSLWKIDADATTDVVKQYYDGLSKGGGRTEAMRQAQLAILADSKRSHPHYWASFIVSGNDNAMDGHPVEPTFSRITRGGTCGACEIGTYESSGGGVWLGIAIIGAALGLRRRGSHVENRQ